MPAVRLSDLDPKTQAKIAEQWPEAVGSEIKQAPSRTSPVRRKSRKRGKRREWYVWPLVALVAGLAWILMGVGWFISEVGDVVYYLGKRMHEAKWNID